MDDLVQTLATRAMGTRFELVLVAPGALADGDDRVERRRLRAAAEAAFEVIHETEARWSLFQASSRLTRLNLEGHRRPVVLDADDLDLWTAVLALREATDRAFDVDVGRTMGALGHHATGDRGAHLPPPPDPDAPAGELVLEGRHLSLSAPGPVLDLGAVAKGHALDLAARELADAGVTCALLHGGTSSVRALGAPPPVGGGPGAWRVRVPAWSLGDDEADRDLDLVDLALGASHASAQTTPAGAGHLVDPRTGQPVRSARGALVTAPRALVADAWATALCIDPTLAPRAAAAGVTVHHPLPGAEPHPATPHASGHAAPTQDPRVPDAAATD